MANSITVIMPCYNAEQWVAEAINSVKNQLYRNWRCIIVDDGSTDRSGEIIDKETEGDERFTVLHTKNHGVAAARNLAIFKAGGGYILPFDADDILVPQALQRFSETWEKNPDASLLVPMICKFKKNTRKIQSRKWEGYENLKDKCTPTNSSCFKWDDWNRVGGYRDGTMYEDWEFWLRLLFHNDKVVNIPEVLIEYRRRIGSRLHEALKQHDLEVENIKRMNPDIFKPYLVVIPYLAKGSQGNELELAVTGWRKYFREPYHIIVVGDYHPIVKTGEDISFIDCPQMNPIPGQYLANLDIIHKFRKVREVFPESKGFIYTCDDIYPTANITLKDIMAPKHPERGFFFKLKDWRTMPVDWYSDKQKTGELCDNEGLPRRNWVCHLPVYYEWEKLFNIYDKYDCDHVSYIVENIYFNIEYPGDPHAEDCFVYRDEIRSPGQTIRPIGSVKWITNAVGGWSPEMEAMLRKHYGI